MTALSGSVLDTDNDYSVAGMVFTEGIRPHPRVMELVERSGIPTMLVKEDSFSVATRINNAITKLRSEETEKVSTAKELVEEYVNVDEVIASL